MHSPLPTLSLIFLYLLAVRFGPVFMKNRPAFEMKPVLFFFNSAIVVLYVYLVYEASLSHTYIINVCDTVFYLPKCLDRIKHFDSITVVLWLLLVGILNFTTGMY